MAITANPTVQNGATLTAKGKTAFHNITATTLVKATAGRVARVNVVVAGSGTAVASVYDTNTTGSIAASNKIATIPDVVGSYELDFPVGTGIVLVPGTAQTLSISFN